MTGAIVREKPIIGSFPSRQNRFHCTLLAVSRGVRCPHAKRSQVSTQGLTPLAGWVSKIELQRKLNEPWIVRSLREAKRAIGICVAVCASGLRRCFIQPVLGSDICIKATGIVELRIVMIEGIKELCPELEALLFADGENLKQRDIPVLGAWPLNDVSASIAERSDDCVGGKGAGVKQCSRYTWVSVWISDHVGPRCAGDFPAAIRRGEVGGNVGRCIPVSRGCDGDAGNLPIADDLVPHAG